MTAPTSLLQEEDKLKDGNFLMEQPYTDTIEGIVSSIMLRVSGIKNKYHSPEVNPPEMNKELDILYNKAVQLIKSYGNTRELEGRIDELGVFDKSKLTLAATRYIDRRLADLNSQSLGGEK